MSRSVAVRLFVVGHPRGTVGSSGGGGTRTCGYVWGEWDDECDRGGRD